LDQLLADWAYVELSRHNFDNARDLVRDMTSPDEHLLSALEDRQATAEAESARLSELDRETNVGRGSRSRANATAVLLIVVALPLGLTAVAHEFFGYEPGYPLLFCLSVAYVVSIFASIYRTRGRGHTRASRRQTVVIVAGWSSFTTLTLIVMAFGAPVSVAIAILCVVAAHFSLLLSLDLRRWVTVSSVAYLVAAAAVVVFPAHAWAILAPAVAFGISSLALGWRRAGAPNRRLD
jgi:hypothetical protein